ncbi:MAG: ion channel [Leptospirales bacterium]
MINKGIGRLSKKLQFLFAVLDLRSRQWKWVRFGRLSPQVWFPHVPLALGLGLFGYRNIRPLLDQVGLLREGNIHFGPVEKFNDLPAFFHDLTKGPHSIIGIVEILMAVGLLFRSRFAWSVGLVLSGASLAILVQKTHGIFSPRAMGNLLILLGLLFFRKDFSRSSLATGTLFSLISIVLLFGYSIFGAYLLGDGFKPPIQSLMTALYFSVVTMSTVGYGDIVPRSDDARMFVLSVILLGISVFMASLSTVILPMMNERVQHLLMGGKRKMVRKDHYILVGTGGLAYNAFLELTRRKLPVTLVVDRVRTETPWDLADQVEGDPADTETLKKAGIVEARALISLLDNDGENAFVVLAARESGSRAKTIVSVRDRVNLARIKSVRPDMILAMDVIGAEILGMALSGEPVDGDQLLKRILFMDGENSKMDPNHHRKQE